MSGRIAELAGAVQAARLAAETAAAQARAKIAAAGPPPRFIVNEDGALIGPSGKVLNRPKRKV